MYNGPENEKARWLGLVELGKREMREAFREGKAIVFKNHSAAEDKFNILKPHAFSS